MKEPSRRQRDPDRVIDDGDACQPGAQILDRVLKHELWYDYGYVISYGLD